MTETISLKTSGLTFSGLSKGEGPVVLCLHGFPDNHRSFRYQLPVLANAGYRVVVPTMRGYEPSSQPADNNYCIDALAQDVIGWIDELGESRVHLIGHDWGAAVSYAAAARAPDRFHSLTTIAVPHGGRMASIGLRKVPSQLKKSWYMMFFQLRGVADVSIELNDWALIKQLWRQWSPDYCLPDDEWNSLRSTFAAPGVGKAMLSYYRQIVPPTIVFGLRKGGMSDLKKIPVRTLAITGERDGCIDTRLYDHVMLERDFPEGLKVERIKGAGHFTHQEKPDEVNKLLIDWLAQS